MEPKYSMKLSFGLMTFTVLMIFMYLIHKDVSWPKPLTHHPVYPYKYKDQNLTLLKDTKRILVSAYKDHRISIIPLKDTKHFIVSAYKDHRTNGAIRIISIINRNQLGSLSCVASCAQRYFVTTAEVNMHSDHFGFPFVTTDLLCHIEPSCSPTHITISNSPSVSDISSKTFLPIQNIKKVEHDFPYNFTACISNLFGDYNNVLQFVQTIEIYKILGVQKVYIYNTSCGPDLEKVLQYYKEEGILEVEPWPIDHFLNPSKGWNFQEHKGDIHYYGQLTTLNDCIYRNMYRSKYLLLNDIDEIIVPYQHATLGLLMEELQQKHPSVNVFIFENHIFPKTVYDSDGRFSLPQWKKVPGINILEHVYREPDRTYVFNPTKMIVNPREVVQTSVHSVLNNYGDTLKVPFHISRLIHVREPLQGSLQKNQLIVDTKLWDYERKLIPNIDRVLKDSGIYD